jgi:hypothetical protein
VVYRGDTITLRVYAQTVASHSYSLTAWTLALRFDPQVLTFLSLDTVFASPVSAVADGVLTVTAAGLGAGTTAQSVTGFFEFLTAAMALQANKLTHRFHTSLLGVLRARHLHVARTVRGVMCALS